MERFSFMHCIIRKIFVRLTDEILANYYIALRLFCGDSCNIVIKIFTRKSMQYSNDKSLDNVNKGKYKPKTKSKHSLNDLLN